MFVCPSIRDTDSMETPRLSISVAKVWRATWHVRFFSMPHTSAISFVNHQSNVR